MPLFLTGCSPCSSKRCVCPEKKFGEGCDMAECNYDSDCNGRGTCSQDLSGQPTLSLLSPLHFGYFPIPASRISCILYTIFCYFSHRYKVLLRVPGWLCWTILWAEPLWKWDHARRVGTTVPRRTGPDRQSRTQLGIRLPHRLTVCIRWLRPQYCQQWSDEIQPAEQPMAQVRLARFYVFWTKL